jgi:hypothetical protein
MLPGNNAAERPPSLRSPGDVVVRGTNATIKTVNGTAASLNLQQIKNTQQNGESGLALLAPNQTQIKKGHTKRHALQKLF